MTKFTTMYSPEPRWSRRPFASVVIALFLSVFLSFVPAQSMTDLYQLESSTGRPTDMSGSTQLFSAYQSNSSSVLTDIGFDFYFDNILYTNFSVTPSGLMSFGHRPYATYYPYYWPDASVLSNSYPAVCAYWGRYFYPGSNGKVHYKLSGTAPNRVLTVEWLNVQYFGSSSQHYATYQVRLYERTNRIEFYYDNMSRPTSSSTSYSAAIGIAASSTRYINVYGNVFPNEIYLYPSGRYTTYYLSYNDPITNGTLYSFSPCERNLSFVGNEAEGGTADMEAGDELLSGKEVMRGDNAVFHPLTLSNPDNACNNLDYTMSLSGPGAGDYSVPTRGTVSIGENFTPDILFTPQVIGDRSATLTITLSNGERISYALNARGLTRVNWIGDQSQGGTPNMGDGDKLLANIELERGTSGQYTPFTLRNINTRQGSADAVVTYILDDPYDEYTIRLSGAETGTEKSGAQIAASATVVDYVAPGGTSTPIITFAPHGNGAEYGSGPQPATLTVIADGEERVFILNGFSIAPAAEFYFNGTERVIGSDRTLFRDVVTCVGQEVTTVEFRVENVNRRVVYINAFEAYEMDSRVRQGKPAYPMQTDIWGNLVPMADYILTEAPGTAPVTANEKLQFPLVINPGETKVYHLTFIAHRPGKRYGRVFLRTNCVNFFGGDTRNYLLGQQPVDPTEGLMTMEFFGRGVGGDLAKNMEGALKGLALTFDPVKVGGNTGSSQVTVYNSGECDLRISKEDIRPVSGDIAEFELTEVFAGMNVDNEGNYVIPPGGQATIKATFTPVRSGSRRATVLLRTNDSTIYTEGITERGVYYLNLYGVGKADLRAHHLQLSPAVIDGPGTTGVLSVENTSTDVIEINGLTVTGANADEITENPAAPWPTLPQKLLPGAVLQLSVAFNPLAGSTSGMRKAAVEITYGGGDVLTAQVSGLAGTRLLTTSSPTLFDDISIPVGEVVRRTAVISNTGTFPVTLNDIVVEGTSAADYSFRMPERLTLNPGGSEFVEVTFAPSVAGTSAAVLVFKSNATNGDQTVTLGGLGTGTQHVGDPNGWAAPGESGAVNAARTMASFGFTLGQNAPNPARDAVEITYTLPEGGAVELSLYDPAGRLVTTAVNGVQNKGVHTIQLNVSDLPSGLYVYVLRQNSQVLTRSMKVVK